MDNVDPGPLREHQTGQVPVRSNALRRKIQRAGLGLCQRDQRLQIVRRHRWIDDNDVGHESRSRNRSEIAGGFITEISIQKRIEHQRAGGDGKQRMAVCRGMHHRVDADSPVGARAVFDHHRMPPDLAKPPREQAGNDVTGAACLIGRDNRDLMIRERLGPQHGARARGYQHDCCRLHHPAQRNSAPSALPRLSAASVMRQRSRQHGFQESQEHGSQEHGPQKHRSQRLGLHQNHAHQGRIGFSGKKPGT